MELENKTADEIKDLLGKLTQDEEETAERIAEAKQTYEATDEFKQFEMEKQILKDIKDEIEEIKQFAKNGYQTKLFQTRKVKNITKGTSSTFLSPN